MTNAIINTDWLQILETEFTKPYMNSLRTFLIEQKKQGRIIFPTNEDVFAAFNSTPFADTKVVILGQDPYHGLGQGHGLAFSVRPGIAIPHSLQNIYKELHSDLGVPIPKHGYLKKWAEAGVLLLNSVLTVNKNQPASHRNQGWEDFTDYVIKYLSAHKEHLVYILWGSFAKKKSILIDSSKHLILSAPHPSPLSVHKGFFGSKPFSRTNDYLQKYGFEPIDWALE